jgi:VanZ family protein
MSRGARHTGGVIHRHPFLSLVTAAYLGFVGWLTLTPQPIDAADQDLILRALAALHRRGYLEWVDYTRLEFLANIALFVPVGAFLVLLLGARWWWVALGACVAMTGFIETAQQAIPGRVPDDRDLVANSLGAMVGVVTALVLTAPAEIRHARARRARRARQASPSRQPVRR